MAGDSVTFDTTRDMTCDDDLVFRFEPAIERDERACRQ